jgi:MFS transporter, DHA2 family, multidrug resistance protein
LASTTITTDQGAAALSFHDTWKPRANPWLIAITVTLATFMEALDSSIANVALPHIAGSLSATTDEGTWVLTSYLVSNAVVLPISGWISNRIGRKRFYMTCVLLFTLTSLLCGLAPSLGMLVIFRIIQGAAGGGLQPSEQSILADTFPPAKRSMAFAIYGMAVVLAPAIGPTVGGWITDNYSWRWIFFLNIPVGIVSLYFTRRLVEDPPYLDSERKRRVPVDYWGLGLLVVAIGGLQMMLDKGQEDDWFSSRFIVGCAVAAGAGLVLFLARELTTDHPIIDLRLFRKRNFAMTQLVMFMVGASLYSSTVLIPQFLQQLMGYSAERAGMALSIGGLVLMVLFPVAGLITNRFDPRLIVTCGFVLTTIGLVRLANLNLGVDFGTAVSWRAMIACGLPFLFVPINTMCYIGIPQNKFNEVSGMNSLMRNVGGSVGISFVTTLIARREQAHQSALAVHMRPGSVAYERMLSGLAGAYQHSGMAMPDAVHHAAAQLYRMMQLQARTLAYVDTVWVLVFLTACLIPLPYLMQRPKRNQSSAPMH